MSSSSFLVDLGLSPAAISKVNRVLTLPLAQAIEQDPYHLVPIVGFEMADTYARRSGVPITDPRRTRALAVHLLRRAALEDGQTCLPIDRLIQKVGAGSVLDDAEVHAAVMLAADVGLLRLELGRAYLREHRRTERALAQRLKELTRVRPKKPLILVPDGRLSLQQASVAVTISTRSLTVLTGGPGTGKTTAVRNVVQAAYESHLKVVLCAPTGKAARRLQDSTGHEATTIHRLLGLGLDPGRKGQTPTIAADLVVADETSMMGDELTLALLQAVRPGARLLLVGDPDQLPPIEPGMPLAVLTRWLPTVHLTQVYRQAGESPILTLAYDLIAGETPHFDRALPFRNATWANDLAELAIQGVQLLSPTRKGPLGVEALNRAVQALTPGGETVPVTGGVIRVGDPVTQLRNNHTTGIMNGMLGTVLKLSEKTSRAFIDFDGRVVEYRKEARRELMPAYAMTVHRSQGSEWPRVAVALSEGAGLLLSRNLAYTAVTRAREQVIPTGTRSGWTLAAHRALEPRYSGLLDRLDAGT